MVVPEQPLQGNVGNQKTDLMDHWSESESLLHYRRQKVLPPQVVCSVVVKTLCWKLGIVG